MKKAVMIRKPEYYTSFNAGDEMTLVKEIGYNSFRDEREYKFRRADGEEQYIMENDFRWLSEKDIVAGDIVRITDVSRVICAHFYFKNGDTTKVVVGENEEGGMFVKVPENAARDNTQYKHGEPVLYITKEERKYFEKVTQDTQDTETHVQDTKECRIAELEAEVAELKEQLAAAKTLLKGAL